MSESPAPSCASCGQVETNPGEPVLRFCGGCKKVKYCNKQCQSREWKKHKKICKSSQPHESTTANPDQPVAIGDRKRVVLVTLAGYSWLQDDEMLKDFYRTMESRCDLIKVKTAADAVSKTATNPTAIIFFEPTIMDKAQRNKHHALSQAVVAYAKSGGTVVFGGHCSSSATPRNIEWYFSTVWDLPWKSGNYARYDFKPNPDVATIKDKTLPTRYNVKALQLNNVDQGAVVYRQGGGANGVLAQMAASGMLDFEPHGSDPEGKGGPVIWKKYGEGWVAWLGDVNDETDTHNILMIMCGL